MYYFCVLTDFYTSGGFGFGIARKMMYLCTVIKKAGGGHPM